MGAQIIAYQMQYFVLPVALWLIGVTLAVKFIRATVRAYGIYLSRKSNEEQYKYRISALHMMSYGVILLLVIIAAGRITALFGLPVGAIVSITTVVSAALVFGARDILSDVFRGLFIILERQYGIGDYVHFSTDNGEKEGEVESITMRMTKIRTIKGGRVYIPNGSTGIVTNQTQEFSVAVCDIPLPPPPAIDTDIVAEILNQVCEDIWAGSGNIDSILEEKPYYVGVTRLEPTYVVVQIRAKTKAGCQWEAERSISSTCITELAEYGITQSEITILPEDKGGTA